MQCYCASARQVARRLTRLYEAELRPAGLNPAQFELLANLQGRPGASQAELAHAMDVDQTTLSRNLRLVMKEGWIRSEFSAKDGRRIEYQLTSGGSKTLRRAMPCWEKAMARVQQALGSEAQRVFRTLDLMGEATR